MGEFLPTIESTGGVPAFFQSFDGARIRTAHWPAPQSPAGGGVLVLPGRTEFIEKYLEIVMDLRRRNLAVWVLDWRGQGKSSRLLPNRQKGHVESFDDYLMDLQLFAVENLRGWNDGPLHMLTHSMGGTIGLRFLQDHPGLFATAVHSAPMIGIPASGGIATIIARCIAETSCVIGLGNRYIPGGHDYGVRERTFTSNPLTADEARFQRTHAYIDRDPSLALGAPTLGWLRAAMRSCATLRKLAYSRPITLPNMLVCAEIDKVVNNRATLRLGQTELPDAQVEIIPGSHHEILVERDPVRAAFWSLFDEFSGVAGI